MFKQTYLYTKIIIHNIFAEKLLSLVICSGEILSLFIIWLNMSSTLISVFSMNSFLLSRQ